MKEVYVIFDGPPGHNGGRFVELEDANGNSVNSPGWMENQKKGFWRLGPLYLAAESESTESKAGGYDELLLM